MLDEVLRELRQVRIEEEQPQEQQKAAATTATAAAAAEVAAKVKIEQHIRNINNLHQTDIVTVLVHSKFVMLL